MTVGEVKTVVDCYTEKMNEDILLKNHFTYNVAYLTAWFVNNSFSGKSIPSYEEVFDAEKAGDNSWIYYKEKLTDYKDEWNMRMKKQGGK